MLANPAQFGGPGRVVAIDESLVAWRKPGNAQGRGVPEMWVFGGVDTITHDFFMELVPRRDSATLLPLIQRYILPGTTIWSNEWAAYNGLAALGYPHQTVNHSQTYVNPPTGVHTNHIESQWNACKAKFKAHFGVQRDFTPTYLDEYIAGHNVAVWPGFWGYRVQSAEETDYIHPGTVRTGYKGIQTFQTL